MSAGDLENIRPAIADLLFVNYHATNIYGKTYQIIIWLLYVLGFGLVAIPTLETFYKVLMSFMAVIA